MTESQTETKSATESATKSKPGQLPVDDVRSLIDACWKAKTITELIPALPKGMKPRYVHVIDAVWHINEPNGQDTGTARVGDVSAFLGVTTPSITKLVGEMADLGLVVKHADATDRRAVTLTLAERGLDIRHIYVEEYHAHLSQLLGGLTSDQCETTVRRTPTTGNNRKTIGTTGGQPIGNTENERMEGRANLMNDAATQSATPATTRPTPQSATQPTTLLWPAR